MRGVAPNLTDLDQVAQRFFELLETDRESELFLIRFRELDQVLEAALAAQGHAAFGQELSRGAAKAQNL